MIIGFAGPMGAGKTSAAEHLRDQQAFYYTRYSLVLAEMYGNVKASKAELQEFGGFVMKNRQAELNERLISNLPSIDIAVDGLRCDIDYNALKERYMDDFILVYVNASDKVRQERLLRPDRYATIDEFKIADGQPVEGRLRDLRSVANVLLDNETSMSAYLRRIDEVLVKFKISRRAEN